MLTLHKADNRKKARVRQAVACHELRERHTGRKHSEVAGSFAWGPVVISCPPPVGDGNQASP
jgi:hypothetical protein